MFATVNLRASAQENRAKGGHSRKPNLPSFSVYKEVLTSLQYSSINQDGRWNLSKIVHFQRASTERWELAWVSYCNLLFGHSSELKSHLELNTFCLLLGRLKNTTIAI